jgi:hypothetical protein
MQSGVFSVLSQPRGVTSTLDNGSQSASNVNKTTLNEIEFVKRILESGQAAILFGAGVSRESGVPTVRILLENLCHLADYHTPAIIDRLCGVQFEQVISGICGQADIDGLLRVFDGEVASVHHELYSQLALQNHVRLLFTSNFDCLMEQALRAKGINFKRLSTRVELFAGLPPDDGESVHLIKLHGSIDEASQLAVTIESVANHSQATLVGPLIQAALGLHGIRFLLVFGYSMSDHFDIVPALNEGSLGETRILYWRHSPTPPVGLCVDDRQALAFIEGAAPCSITLEGDTRLLAESLLLDFGGSIPSTSAKQRGAWLQKLDDWWQHLSPSRRCGVKSSLATRCGNFCDSLSFNRAGFELALHDGDLSSAGSHSCNIGTRLMERKETDQAKVSFQWVLDQGDTIPKHIRIFTRLQEARRLILTHEYEESTKQVFLAMADLKGTPFSTLVDKGQVDPLEADAPLWVNLMCTLGVALCLLEKKEIGYNCLEKGIEIARKGGMLVQWVEAAVAKARLLAIDAGNNSSQLRLKEAQEALAEIIPYVDRVFPSGGLQQGQFLEVKAWVFGLLPLALALGWKLPDPSEA